MKTIRVTAFMMLMSMSATPLMADVIAKAAPSNHFAVAAGDIASPALAQLNDAADTANAAQKIDLYKQLMELNGQARNIRNVIDNTRSATRLIILNRDNKQNLSDTDLARYNSIASAVLGQTESSLIHDIAVAQSQSFSADEIRQLIAANSSVAAAKYNSAKFSQGESSSQQIQSYMYDAVIKIIKTFQESMAS